MSNLTEEELKRLRQVRWAATGQNFAKFEVGRADVILMAKRLEQLELAEHAVSEEMLRWMLERLKEDRKFQREWLADLLDQIRIAELQAMEADEAVKAVEALIAGGIHGHGAAIIARWDAVQEDFRARGLLPPSEAIETPPEPLAQVETPTPVAVIADPEPSPELAPEPTDDLSHRVLSALGPLIEEYGQDLNAMRFAERLNEPQERVRVVLAELERAGHLQMVKRLDRNMYAILRPGEKLETPELSANQAKLFEALVGAAGEDWTASISRGRLKQLTGINPGSLDQILWALERKDRIRILERGNSTTPTKFLICEGARPERRVLPKTDEELIAEALAAGKVTQCPPAHVH